MITLTHFIVLSAIIFCIGLIGLTIRKNILIILMSLEIILNAVNLSFISFARKWSGMNVEAGLSGQVFAFFIMTVAAAEVAVALAIIINVYLMRENLDVEEMNLMKW